MPYMDIQPITANQIIVALLAICAMIALVGGAIGQLLKFGSPFKKINRRLDDHDKRLDGHDAKLAKDLERFEAVEAIVEGAAACDRIMLEALDVILAHQEKQDDGETTSRMRKKLRDYIIHERK